MSSPRGSLVALSSAVLALLQGSSSSEPGVREARGETPRGGREGEEREAPLLLVPPRIEQPMMLAHRSHSSHRSHRSSSYSGGGYAGGYEVPVGSPAVQAPAPAPAPPKPAQVTLVAYPGGRIFVDGKLVGTDSTSPLTLQPGSHDVRIENRFVGDTTQTIRVDEGQVGILMIQW